jgi:hypothetical protein
MTTDGVLRLAKRYTYMASRRIYGYDWETSIGLRDNKDNNNE